MKLSPTQSAEFEGQQRERDRIRSEVERLRDECYEKRESLKAEKDKARFRDEYIETGGMKIAYNAVLSLLDGEGEDDETSSNP